MNFKRIGIMAAILFAACNKPAPRVQRVILHPNKSIWKSWIIEQTPKGDTLIQGPYKEFYWNGSPSQVTQYTDGVKEGTSQAWYDNGAAKWSKVFRGGKRAEVWRLFSSDGRPRVEVAYENGALHGLVKIWNKNDTSVVQVAQYARDQCASGACEALDSLRNIPGEGTDPANRAEAELLGAFFE